MLKRNLSDMKGFILEWSCKERHDGFRICSSSGYGGGGGGLLRDYKIREEKNNHSSSLKSHLKLFASRPSVLSYPVEHG